MISEVNIRWNGNSYRLDLDGVIRAFEKAPTKHVTGPYARYFVEIEGDLKPVVDVVVAIVPVPLDELGNEKVRMFKEIFEAMGFRILDRQKHHMF